MASKGYASTQLDNIPSDKVQKITHNLMELNAMGQPQTNEELSDRIDAYFDFCEHSSLRPGVESLCLALHISRTTLYRWSIGESCDKERQDLVLKAKQMVSAFIEQASLSGQLNPATAIFLQKNWFSYKDTISIEEAVSSIEDKKPLTFTNSQLAARLGDKLQNYTAEDQGGEPADD